MTPPAWHAYAAKVLEREQHRHIWFWSAEWLVGGKVATRSERCLLCLQARLRRMGTEW